MCERGTEASQSAQNSHIADLATQLTFAHLCLQFHAAYDTRLSGLAFTSLTSTVLTC